MTPPTAAEALEKNTNLIVSVLIEREGHVLLVDNGSGGLAPPETVVENAGASAALTRLIASTGLLAQPGFMYSVFEDVDHKRQHISFLCQAAEGEPSRGLFVPLTSSALDDVTDPATRTMLERFANESVLGNYGIYYGDQSSGEALPITSGS